MARLKGSITKDENYHIYKYPDYWAVLRRVNGVERDRTQVSIKMVNKLRKFYNTTKGADETFDDFILAWCFLSLIKREVKNNPRSGDYKIWIYYILTN